MKAELVGDSPAARSLTLCEVQELLEYLEEEHHYCTEKSERLHEQQQALEQFLEAVQDNEWDTEWDKVFIAEAKDRQSEWAKGQQDLLSTAATLQRTFNVLAIILRREESTHE